MPDAYDHTFEIAFDGKIISGELNLQRGQPASFITTSGEELTVAQHGGFQKFLESVVDFYNACGDIKHIYVNKKV